MTGRSTTSRRKTNREGPNAGVPKCCIIVQMNVKGRRDNETSEIYFGFWASECRILAPGWTLLGVRPVHKTVHKKEGFLSPHRFVLAEAVAQRG